MNIEIKSIGVLIDELCTTNIKCFMAQERLMSATDDSSKASAAVDAQKLNARRCNLIDVINRRTGDGDISPTGKTYS